MSERMSVPAAVQSIRADICSRCPTPCDNQQNPAWHATACAACPLEHAAYPQRWHTWGACAESAALTELRGLGDAVAVPPPLTTQLATATTAAFDWAKSGFAVAKSELYQSRLATCQSCEFWKDQFGGRCLKCGCSTQAKLRMASAACPLGKW
jgi:hypothetical protein